MTINKDMKDASELEDEIDYALKGEINKIYKAYDEFLKSWEEFQKNTIRNPEGYMEKFSQPKIVFVTKSAEVRKKVIELQKTLEKAKHEDVKQQQPVLDPAIGAIKRIQELISSIWDDLRAESANPSDQRVTFEKFKGVIEELEEMVPLVKSTIKQVIQILLEEKKWAEHLKSQMKRIYE